MSVESQRRLIGGLRQAVGEAKSGNRRGKASGKPRRQSFKEVIEQLEREAPAVQAIVALALELAGTDKLLPPEPEPLASDVTMVAPEVPVPPPRLPRPKEGRVWTKDVRPGPHDILTWEEAMQVPWFDSLAEAER